MRLPTERFAGRVYGLACGLILAAFLTGCGSHSEIASASPAPAQVNGPAADYPVVIGSSYKIGDKLYTPVDTMNYDEVGYLAADGGTGITASHHTLPLPSYAEVTSLKTGHTILVRVERRGPMSGDQVIALSPAALAQLGSSAGDPVRVRRVNPPEAERAALRAGRAAPARMDTPASLVAVLKQKLPAEGSANLAPHRPAIPVALASADVPPSAAKQVSEPMAPPALPPLPSRKVAVDGPAPAPAVAARREQLRATDTPATRHSAPEPAKPATTIADSAFMVQAATMSTIERAQKVAGSIGGSIARAGQYFRVRTGPFATREQAEASLAKVKAAGYSDARIFTNG